MLGKREEERKLKRSPEDSSNISKKGRGEEDRLAHTLSATSHGICMMLSHSTHDLYPPHSHGICCIYTLLDYSIENLHLHLYARSRASFSQHLLSSLFPHLRPHLHTDF
jgi:hypothetical protein